MNKKIIKKKGKIMKTLDMTKYSFYTDGKTKVIAVSTYAGKAVRGVAKCDEKDAFSFEDGKKLAAARCNEKVAKKRLARANKVLKNSVNEYAKATKKLQDMLAYCKDSEDALYNAEVLTDEILETM